jgi:hypothetical protein
MYPTIFLSKVHIEINGMVPPQFTFHNLGVNCGRSPIFAAMQSSFLFRALLAHACLFCCFFSLSGNACKASTTGQQPAALAETTGLAPSHEFYVGLTDIVYNAGTGRYEITLKLFTDDLELALERAFGRKAVLTDPAHSSDLDSLVFDYLRSKFAVKGNRRQLLALNPIGRETEMDVTWIYLESAVMQPLQTAFVTNSLLMELYEDQSHIVHITQGGRTRSTLLRQGLQSDRIDL